MRLLLLSNSMNPGSGYLEHALPAILEHLADARTLAFVPYAAVRVPWDEFEARVTAVFAKHDIEVRGVQRYTDPRDVVATCDAVAVGGGNTFQLVDALHRTGLMETIGARVHDGAPFVGWSAGANVACPTLRTTNDMPIVEPRSFATLHFVPFQINPHYLDAHAELHMGESREERILEFIRANPDVPVVGLREGSMLRRMGARLELLGPRTARIFREGTDPAEFAPGSNLDFLLE